jgi:hypothetical protein
MSDIVKGLFEADLVSSIDPPDRFDLEQEIMKCWQITDELELLYAASDSIDTNSLQNVLLGLTALYEMKFNKLFQTFEAVVARGFKNNGL